MSDSTNELDNVVITTIDNLNNKTKRKYTRKAKVVQDGENNLTSKKRKYTRKAKVEQGEGTHDPAPKRRHIRINPVHNLTFDELLQEGVQETIQEVELTKEQREKMVGLAYEKLNEKYYRVKYLNLDLIMDVNGYCNATNMCLLGGKQFKNWTRTNHAKENLKTLQQHYPNVNLLYQENSREYDEIIRGTYVHPNLIVNIGMWISSKIAIGASIIVNEWRNTSTKNNLRFMSLLSNGLQDARENQSEEKQWQQFVFEHEDGNPQMEVKVEKGRIDVLTQTKLIEIKNFNDVDSGIGQLLRYQMRLSTMTLYNNQELWLYVFVSKDDEEVTLKDKEFLEALCKKSNIFVKFLN